jgi:signal recognition particle receptor subunit beta
VVFFNYTTMQMTAKIVYYGPGLCGKTTNLQAIHQKTAPGSRGEMVSLETETDRTLFFDLLPLDVGVIGGMKLRLQLYTVPGQVFYNATRKLVLKGVDGIVFVADSQAAARETNIESLGNLRENLAELNLTLDRIPVVFQYNKRDIRSILSVEELNATLNTGGAPHFEAAALHGVGVFETLKAISRLGIQSVRKKIADDSRPTASVPAIPGPAPAVVAAPPAPPVHIRPRAAAPQLASVDVMDPLAGLLGGAPASVEDVPLEFAEEDSGEHRVRAVATKANVDIQQELAKLRDLTAASGSKKTPSSPPKNLNQRLQDILAADSGPRQDVKRKAHVDVPEHQLRGVTGVKVHLEFEGERGPTLVREALTVPLVGTKRLDRLSLHLDIEVKATSET